VRKDQAQALVLFPITYRPPNHGAESPGDEPGLSVLLAGDASDLAQESLAGSSIGCLGSEGVVMRQRLKQFLAGNLDT
jgi:hypothetical protein